jgi:hypothetical protein
MIWLACAIFVISVGLVVVLTLIWLIAAAIGRYLDERELARRFPTPPTYDIPAWMAGTPLDDQGRPYI